MSDVISRLNSALKGRYSVERELGEGGMATVYLADDLKHRRKVALKVLKPELAAVIGADRFVAEIRTTAQLQHPHILPLFDSGEADSFLYYVMPFVEGESLREKLDRESQLPVDEAVKIAAAVASALHYAHTRDVVHRDIKPANILIHAGQPVVADFGIALAISAAGSGRLTETGMSVGTPHYMSPEQASADRDVGPKSDVYALASVLYEMLAGDPPHTGPNAQAVLMRILTEDPRDLSEVRRAVPHHLRDAVFKGLEKLPADRFESAEAFGRALGDGGFTYAGSARGGSTSSTGPSSASHPTPPLFKGLVAATVLLSGLAAWGWFRPHPGPEPAPAMRSSLDLGAIELDGGDKVMISPDGEHLAFVGTLDPTTFTRAIFVRSATDLEFRPLPGTEGDVYLNAFSPDGQWILYGRWSRDGAELLKVSLLGGAPVPIVAEEGLSTGNADWADDGTVVFFGAQDNREVGLYSASEDGGNVIKLTDVEDMPGQPRVLPGGRGILFDRREGGVQLFERASESVRLLVPGAKNAQYLASGHLVYLDDSGGLWAVTFDLSTLTPVGDAKPVLSGVGGVGTFRFGGRYSVSGNGTLVYGTGGATGDGILGSELVIVGLDGTETPIDLQPRFFFRPVWSPSGRHVAYQGQAPQSTSDPIQGTQIYVYDVLIEGAPRPLTTGRWNGWPVWSPDGARVIYTSPTDDDGDNVLHLAYLDGRRSPKLLIPGPGPQRPVDWPAEDIMVFQGDEPEGLYVASLEGDSVTEVRAYYTPEARVGGGAVAPDGSHLAYNSDETGRNEVYIRTFPEPGVATRISEDGGFAPIWSEDGTQIYYSNLTRDSMMVATVGAGLDRVVTSVAPLRAWPYDWPPGLHPDGDRFIAVRRATGDGEAGATLPERHILVHNWFDELRRIFEDEGR